MHAEGHPLRAIAVLAGMSHTKIGYIVNQQENMQ